MTKPVLIIGGSSGIGLALARYYENAGGVVCVVSRKPKPQQTDVHWLQDEQCSEAVSAQVVEQALQHKPETIYICNGVLHDSSAQPEKTIRQLDNNVLLQRLQSNVAVPALYLKLVFSYLCKTPDIRVLVLSAKVGSITDNALGGWYSYRISKAALNMLVKNLSIEVARLNKTAAIVSLHPGTTDTALSAPFQANLLAGQLQTAASTAARLVQVADALEPQTSGALLNWDGAVLPF